MLNVLPEGILPGAERRFYPSRDVASFPELYTIANQIYSWCLLTGSQTGWGVAGKQLQQAMVVSGDARERR